MSKNSRKRRAAHQWAEGYVIRFDTPNVWGETFTATTQITLPDHLLEHQHTHWLRDGNGIRIQLCGDYGTIVPDEDAKS